MLENDWGAWGIECLTTSNAGEESELFNGVAERKLAIIEMTSKAAQIKAAQIQAPLLFPGAEITTRDDLWAEGAS